MDLDPKVSKPAWTRKQRLFVRILAAILTIIESVILIRVTFVNGIPDSVQLPYLQQTAVAEQNKLLVEFDKKVKLFQNHSVKICNVVSGSTYDCDSVLVTITDSTKVDSCTLIGTLGESGYWAYGFLCLQFIVLVKEFFHHSRGYVFEVAYCKDVCYDGMLQLEGIITLDFNQRSMKVNRDL